MKATLLSTKRVRASINGMCLVLLLASGAAQARQTVGVFRGWAAFRDESPARCFAIAAPDGQPEGKAFVSVANWPRARARNQLHARLSRQARPGSAILLSIDGRVFQLVGRGGDAWAADARGGSAIVAAMRTGVEMRIAARDPRGSPFTDIYRLSGAASAIDAAALACRRWQAR